MYFVLTICKYVFFVRLGTSPSDFGFPKYFLAHAFLSDRDGYRAAAAVRRRIHRGRRPPLRSTPAAAPVTVHAGMWSPMSGGGVRELPKKVTFISAYRIEPPPVCRAEGYN